MSDSAIETMLLSEPVLAKDWDAPEEDEAWKGLALQGKEPNAISVPDVVRLLHPDYPDFVVIVPNGSESKKVLVFLAAMTGGVYAMLYPPQPKVEIEAKKRPWWALW